MASPDPELWRKWLEDPAISRDGGEPAPARRHGRARFAHAHTQVRPDNTSAPRRRLALTAVVATAGILVAIVVAAGIRGRHHTEATLPYPIVTTDTPASAVPAAPPPFCARGTVGATVVTDTAGDRTSGPGVIAAYEAAFFIARDPKAALDTTDRGPGVPAEPQLAQGIVQVPHGAPWCVSITDTGAGVFETAVRYLPAANAQPVFWLLNITVADNGGIYTITRIQDKAT